MNSKLTETPSIEVLPFEPLLDSEEAALLLKIDDKTLQALARSGQVPAFRIGKLWRFRASELDKWVRSRISCGNHSRRLN
jgi:excisionase family DNA binding protein